MDTKKKINEIIFKVEDLAIEADILQNRGVALHSAMFEVNGTSASSFGPALFGLTQDMLKFSKKLDAVKDTLFETIKED